MDHNVALEGLDLRSIPGAWPLGKLELILEAVATESLELVQYTGAQAGFLVLMPVF